MVWATFWASFPQTPLVTLGGSLNDTARQGLVVIKGMHQGRPIFDSQHFASENR
jgi:hypothetical protein